MTFAIYDNSSSDWYDIVPFIAFQGVTQTRNDVDGPAAGRNAAGTMIRDRVATKTKFQINTIPIDKTTMMKIDSLLAPETFSIKTDYNTATVQTYTVYSNNVQRVHVLKTGDSSALYKLSFPLVEV